MVLFASIIVILALAGALASWVTGAWLYASTWRTLSAERGQSRLGWLAVVGWPFALKRLDGAATARVAGLNKALVAFFTCLTVAAAATSVATNLARVSR
jgi:hypothetical protein